jgi:hypothetical protein
VKRQTQLSISFGDIGFYIWRIVYHLFSLGVGLWWLRIYASSFIFSIDPFWKNMFFKLKGVHNSFNHALVQFEIT